jgi:hypothetical protein
MIYRGFLLAAYCLLSAFSAWANADSAELSDAGMKMYDCRISVADSDTRKVLAEPLVYIFDYSAKEAVRQALIANEYLSSATSGKYGLVLYSNVIRDFDKFKTGDRVVVYGAKCELRPTP